MKAEPREPFAVMSQETADTLPRPTDRDRALRPLHFAFGMPVEIRDVVPPGVILIVDESNLYPLPTQVFRVTA